MWTVGQRVIARRNAEEAWYPGTIRHYDGQRYYVIFENGEDALLAAQELRELQLKTGDPLEVRSDRALDFQPAKLLAQRDDRLHVSVADGGEVWVSLKQIRLQPGKKPSVALTRAGWELGDRVLACWLDLDWYPGSVLRQLDERVHVLFDNGNQGILEAERIRPIQLAAGDRVYGRWQGGPEAFPGEVASIDGEKVHVKYDDGDEETTLLRLLSLQRDDWLPGSGKARYKVDDRVLACWYDSYWYSGVVFRVDGKRIRILFDDGEQASVTSDKVRDINIAVGDRVFSRREGGPFYMPAEVKERAGERLLVQYDEGEEEWTTVRMLRLEQ